MWIITNSVALGIFVASATGVFVGMSIAPKAKKMEGEMVRGDRLTWHFHAPGYLALVGPAIIGGYIVGLIVYAG